MIPVIFRVISEGVFSVPTETRKRNCQKSIRLHNRFTLKCSTLDFLKATVLTNTLSDQQYKMHVWHNIKMDVCKNFEFHKR
jgi:hypothetical protein